MTLFKNYLENEIEGLEAAGTGIPAATPFTTETIPDPVVGGDATMTCLVFPINGTPVLAVKLEGDAFPRFLLASDLKDGIYLGDGTEDPYNNGGFHFKMVFGESAIEYTTRLYMNNHDIEFAGFDKGVVLRATDNSRHRIRVNPDGTLFTEVI